MSAAKAARSFIDLRAFAAEASPPGATREDAFLSARAPLELAEGPVEIAALSLFGTGAVARLPADEFLILLDGMLVVQSPHKRVRLTPGQSAVLPGGIDFNWRGEPGTRAIVMRCRSGPPGAHQPLAIDERAVLTPSGAPLAELLVGPTPSCRNHADYRSANGEFVCGTWDSTPYHRRPMVYGHHELMHLLDGAVTFVDGAGREATFRQGDIFLVEQGAECSWDSKVRVKKVYAIYRPA